MAIDNIPKYSIENIVGRMKIMGFPDIIVSTCILGLGYSLIVHSDYIYFVLSPCIGIVNKY